MNDRMRWIILLCGGGLLFGVAGGCRVDQQKEIATYRLVLDGPNPTTVPTLAPDSALQLIDALRLANQRNEQLAIQGEDYLQALIERHRAAGAFLPTISLGASHSVQDADGSLDLDHGRLNFDDTRDSTSASVSGQMNLFNGFGDVARLRGTTAGVEQSRQLVLDRQAQVLLDVAQTYYGVIQSERSVEVLRSTIQLQEERVRDTQARVKLGIARPLDLAQSQADLATTRASLVQAINNVATGRATLAYLIGLPAIEGPLIDAYAVPDNVGAIDAWQALAAQRRADLLAAINQVQAARYRVDAAIAQYYPSISIDVQQLLYANPETGDWLASINANLPIFSAYQIESDVRTAWSIYRQAALNEHSIERQAIRDVRVAYADFIASAERVRELEAAVTAAREALRLAEESYKLGNATNLERLDAQDTLLNAELQLVREQFDQKANYLALLRAAGVIGETVSPMQ